MITTARKSFLLSLLFHALMGLMAFIVLTQMRTPPTIKIPMKHIMVLSLNDSAPKPKIEKVSAIPEQITPPTPPKPQLIKAQPITPQPMTPVKAQTPQPTPIQTPTMSTQQTPAVTTPPVVKRSVQNAPAAEIVQTPSKPKIDLAAEKRSFYAQLRNTIQSNLRYPSAARRRGMEGEVGVRFTLHDNGSINAINILNGEGIFHNAAKAAVSSASGINVPKTLADSLPIEIDLTLEFNLKS